MAMMGSSTMSGENRAQEAARKAISSPLLEDVNLKGAKGLLVNITAEPSMTIGEFEAVGNVINEYAAVDANVVIGTAFDSEMQGNLRVTMVATGLVGSRVKETPKVENSPVQVVPPILPARAATNSNPRDLLPRRFGRTNAAAAEVQLDIDDYDIPPFLRKQAD